MSDVSKWYRIKLADGEVEMICTKHTDEGRVLECTEGSVEMDWMEWIDQCALGRVTLIEYPRCLRPITELGVLPPVHRRVDDFPGI